MLTRRNCAKRTHITRRQMLHYAAVAGVERLEARRLLAGQPGLNDAVYHLGGGNSNANDALFGGTLAALGRVANFAATNAPNYTFVNTADQFMYSGDSGAMTPAFLGADAAGMATTDTFNQNDTIYDAEGYFVAPTAGTYTFQVGNGANNEADDILGIYVGGNGTADSGTLVAADGWQGATSPFATDPATPGMATFMLPAGNIPVEIIFGNGFGGAYVHGVTINDPNGAQVSYVTQANAPAPAAPTLNAPTTGDGQVSLTWNSVLFAATYSVFRSDPAHPTPAAIATGITTTSYADKMVTGGTSYTYYVTAVNGSGSSAPSNTQTIAAVAGPATPGNFAAHRAGGTTTVGLSWTASPNAAADTTYDVKRGTALNADGTLGGTIVDVTPGGVKTTTAADTAAAAGSTYYYAVTAMDSSGTSAPSPAAKVGAAPAAVATKLAAEGTVEVDVRASDLPAGTLSTWSNQGTAGGSFNPWTTGAPNVGVFTDANGVSYQAVNFNGSTALKSTFNSPDDLNGNSSRSIEVWVLNPTIDGVEETMVAWARRGGPDGTNESFSYGGTYAVGEWGAEYDMTWAGSAAVGAPTTPPPANLWHNFTFTYDGNGTEDVYVDGTLQLTGASTGLTNIAPLMTAAGFPIDLGAQNDGNGNPAILGNLDIASVRISGGALTADDVTQNFKAGVPGQTAPAAAPTAAPVLNAPTATGGVVSLSWSYIGDAGAGFGYNVLRSDPAHPTPVAVASGVHALSYTDKSVTTGITYTYTVTASNSAGSGPASNAVMATPVAAPATPANFTAGRAGGTTKVFLNWTASLSAPTGTTYDVKRGTALNADGTLGGTIVDVTPGGVTGTSAVDNNAATNATYYYAVTATDTGGTSAPSPAAKVGPAPAAVSTTLAAEGTVEVDVRAVDLPAGPVTSWTNEGTAGGSFVPWTTGAPSVGGFTDANGVTYQTVNFDGTTALKSTFNSPDDLNNNSARSIEVWVLNPTIDGAEETMVSWARRGGPDGTNESFSYGNTYAVGEWGGEYDMTWAGSAASGAPTTPPPANIWHNLTFTYDGNGTEDVYVDGALQLTGASTGLQNVGQLMTAAGFPIGLGAQNDGNGNPAVLGKLDIASVRVSGGALTADDVTKNFKAGVPGQQAPTAAPASAPVLAAPITTGGLVRLNWSYVGDAGAGFGYNVFRSDAAHPTPAAVASNVIGLTYDDTTVTNGVKYTYYVVAKNSAGSGPQSNTVNATPVAVAPATPTNLTAYRVGISNTANLSWTGSQFATSYDVKRGTALNADGTLGGTITDFSNIAGTTFTDASATPGTDLFYTVSAVRTGLASAPTAPVMIAKAPTTSGLNDDVYHLGGGNSNAFNAVFGGDSAAPGRVTNWAATHAPDYSFVNTADKFMYSGDSGAMTPAFLGGDAAGNALTDAKNQNDTIYDAQGYFTAPTAGTYTFQVGNGANNQADDIVGIYVNGDGTPGSGTLVAADGWQGATTPFAVSPSTPGKATFNITTPGKIPVEIIYGNGFGGAFLDGVSITDPTGTQVAYGVQPPRASLPADFNNDGSVGFDDLLILAQNYGKTGVTHSMGDANGDGKVDFADLLILAQSYGKTAAASPARSSLASVVDQVQSKHRRR